MIQQLFAFTHTVTRDHNFHFMMLDRYVIIGAYKSHKRLPYVMYVTLELQGAKILT